MQTAVVYAASGCDLARIRASVASLRRVGINSDVFVLSGGCTVREDAWLSGHGARIVDVSGLMRDVGFYPDGWNRGIPYATLARLTLPLVHELAGYNRALCVSEDVLVENPRFAQWLEFPMRGFELVGAAMPASGDSDGAGADTVEVNRCFTDATSSARMYQRIWSRNPPYSRIGMSRGVSLWDLDTIREDTQWYRDRLAMFWQAECRGYVVGLSDSFERVFMDSAALVSAAMLSPYARSDDRHDPAAVCYAPSYDSTPSDDAFSSAVDRLGLSEAVKTVKAAPAGLPVSDESMPFTSRVSPDLSLAGKLAVVYITDGNFDDGRRMVWSLRSLSRHSRLAFDTYVIAPDAAVDINLAVPGIEAHGSVAYITDMADVLAKLSITDKGWNRSWPFAVLLRLGIPLHSAFAGYDRVLYLDTDTLVRSPEIDWFLTSDLSGVEVGGAVDTVQEENNRIRGVFDNDLRPDYARTIFDRYGAVLFQRAYINAGVLLWNLPEIRKDLQWYKDRLGMFWEAECRGKFGFLDQDFINSMMVTRADYSMVFNWFNGCNRPNKKYALKHYCGHRYAEMEADVRAADLM